MFCRRTMLLKAHLFRCCLLLDKSSYVLKREIRHSLSQHATSNKAIVKKIYKSTYYFFKWNLLFQCHCPEDLQTTFRQHMLYRRVPESLIDLLLVMDLHILTRNEEPCCCWEILWLKWLYPLNQIMRNTFRPWAAWLKLRWPHHYIYGQPSKST